MRLSLSNKHYQTSGTTKVNPQSVASKLVGGSAPMRELLRMVHKAARTHFPVLVLGESGSGKELVAQAIHSASQRREFVPIDCGALVGPLMESELFGHMRGSFSGAHENKRGLVEIAEGGTAFFDEIGDLPLEMQVKLLRLVQESEYRPVGGLQRRKANIRIVAATHRDLKSEVVAGRFRQDLFYRLNVLVIRVPPLRERKEDIPALVQHFLELGKNAGLPGFSITNEMMATFLSYDWPGNVRELKHAVDRIAALHSEGAVQLCELPSALQNHVACQSFSPLPAGLEEDVADYPVRFWPPAMSLVQNEKRVIQDALIATLGVRREAAAVLGVGRTTLYRKMRMYGLS